MKISRIGKKIYLKNWQDERLAYGKIGDQTKKDVEFLVVPSLKDKIWFPDLFFLQERNGKHHTITTLNQAPVLILI